MYSFLHYNVFIVSQLRLIVERFYATVRHCVDLILQSVGLLLFTMGGCSSWLEMQYYNTVLPTYRYFAIANDNRWDATKYYW